MYNDVQKNLWLVVLCTLIMLLIVIFFCVRLIKKTLPCIPEDFFIFSSEDAVEMLVLTPQMRPPNSQISPRWGKARTALLPLEEGLKEHANKERHVSFHPNVIESSLNIDDVSPFKDIPDKVYRLRNLQRTQWPVLERPPSPRPQKMSYQFTMNSSDKTAQKPIRVTYYTNTTKL